MRQDDAGVGEQAAPVAGMVAALAQGELEVEVERAARAAEDGRPAMVEPRAVRADQGIGLERRLVGLAEIGQPGRAGLLAGLDQDGRVEAEVAALLQHAGKGCDVDRVLALVVGGAAAVHAVALDHDLPRRQALPPLLLLAADHVAMAVGQHGRLGGVLDPPRDQERAVFAARVGQHGAVVAELFQRFGHLARDVLLQRRHRILLLAGGRNRHPPLQLGQKAAVVEIFLRAPDGAVPRACHEDPCVIRSDDSIQCQPPAASLSGARGSAGREGERPRSDCAGRSGDLKARRYFVTVAHHPPALRAGPVALAAPAEAQSYDGR